MSVLVFFFFVSRRWRPSCFSLFLCVRRCVYATGVNVVCEHEKETAGSMGVHTGAVQGAQGVNTLGVDVIVDVEAVWSGLGVPGVLLWVQNQEWIWGPNAHTKQVTVGASTFPNVHRFPSQLNQYGLRGIFKLFGIPTRKNRCVMVQLWSGRGDLGKKGAEATK